MLSGEPAEAQEIFHWGIRCVKIRSKSAVGGFARKHIHNPDGLPTIAEGLMYLHCRKEIRG